MRFLLCLLFKETRIKEKNIVIVDNILSWQINKFEEEKRYTKQKRKDLCGVCHKTFNA